MVLGMCLYQSNKAVILAETHLLSKRRLCRVGGDSGPQRIIQRKPFFEIQKVYQCLGIFVCPLLLGFGDKPRRSSDSPRLCQTEYPTAFHIQIFGIFVFVCDGG